MTQDEEYMTALNPSGVTELLKLLQRGEMTADSMEKRLDTLEQELEELMKKLEEHDDGDNLAHEDNNNSQENTTEQIE